MATSDDTTALRPEGDIDVEVEDRGSAVTVFAFAGGANRIGGVPLFEFRKSLRRADGEYNVVLLRDLHRSFYQLQRDGTPGGLDSHARQIEELMSRLGSAHHVAMGTSMGGAAALYFGARCRMQQVIAFSPSWPIDQDVDVRGRLRTWNALKGLLRSPRGYLESRTVMEASEIFYRRLQRTLGSIPIDPMFSEYLDGNPTPAATVYYPTRSPYDAYCAKLISACPQVQMVPVSTGMHNISGLLKRHGLLLHLLHQEIDRGRLQTMLNRASAGDASLMLTPAVQLSETATI